MVMDLAVPLTMSQIEAANRLHQQLSEWKITDRALQRPRHAWITYPGSDADGENPNVLWYGEL